jgi:hypothetical protein
VIRREVSATIGSTERKDICYPGFSRETELIREMIDRESDLL